MTHFLKAINLLALGALISCATGIGIYLSGYPELGLASAGCMFLALLGCRFLEREGLLCHEAWQLKKPPEKPAGSPVGLKGSMALAAGMVAQGVCQELEQGQLEQKFPLITVATWDPALNEASLEQRREFAGKIALPRQVRGLIIRRTNHTMRGEAVILSWDLQLYRCQVIDSLQFHETARRVSNGVIAYYPDWDDRRAELRLWVEYAEEIRLALERLRRQY